MVRPATTTYEFGPFRLEVEGRRLLRDGAPVHLTSKLFDILLMLLGNAGEVVRKEDLLREVWADSFVEENNLTVSMSALRRTLGEKRGEHLYIETVPKRGYRFVARVARPPAENAGPAEGAAGVRAGTSQSRREAVGALAVLPFVNVGGDQELEYLSDGVTEHIIFSLSRQPQFRVMARATVFRYKGSELDARQIGRELGVQAVVVGALRQLGGRVHLSAELVDVGDGSQVWGERYDRPASDVLKVQEEVASEISEKLSSRVLSDEGPGPLQSQTRDPEAHRLYLKGRYFWYRRTLKDVDRAVRYFEEAVSLDPKYALAHAGLADCYISLVYLNALSVDSGLPAIRRAADEALALDETLAEAHSALGFVELMLLNWREAERELARAIELNPNLAIARSRYSTLLALRGRAEEAVAQVDRALLLDPLSPALRVNAARALYYARHYERAAEECREAIDIEPNTATAYGVLSIVYERMGRHEEAIAEIRKAVAMMENDPEPLGILGYLCAISGRRAEARRVLNRMLKLSEQKYVSSFFVAFVYAGLGEKARAIESLERACEERSYVQLLAMSPLFDSLRSDPAFADMLRRTGLAPDDVQAP
ncbi:MAG: winged helix-turn-helix domain-containing protein [Acidobacteria bacterium]|nr:winged helix-turn-helix domain-containing protein [Acidobacteriota bacterium]